MAQPTNCPYFCCWYWVLLFLLHVLYIFAMLFSHPHSFTFLEFSLSRLHLVCLCVCLYARHTHVRPSCTHVWLFSIPQTFILVISIAISTLLVYNTFLYCSWLHACMQAPNVELDHFTWVVCSPTILLSSLKSPSTVLMFVEGAFYASLAILHICAL